MALIEFPPVSVLERGPPPLELRTDDPRIVSLHGEHDVSTVHALAAELARAIAQTDADLTLDLSDVQFMDASTVTVILGARRFLEPMQRTLTLRSPARCARRVIDICHLDPLVDPASASSKETTWDS